MTDANRPNIVLVTVDSLRADHCGCYGYERDTTPTLDAMAEDGVRFERAIAPGPSTPESLPAMFTGQYPRESAAGEGLSQTRTQFRRHLDRHETLSERLARQGYTTAGFTPNPWTCRHFGFDKGFDYFQDFLDEDRSSAIWERMLEGRSSKSLTALRLLSSWMQRENTFKPWPAMYDELRRWTEAASDPYFLWVFLMDVHFPYLPGDESRSQARWRTYEANLRLYLESQTTPYSPRVHDQLVTAYDDAIHYTDRCLARLRSDLEDAVFVVHGDHGEGFGEHGTYGHHGQLHDANVRIPLVVSGAGASTPVADPVSIRSMPALLDHVADGESPAALASDAVRSQTKDGAKTAVRGRDWLYIRNGDVGTLYRVEDGHETRLSADSVMATAAARWRLEREKERERTRVAEAARDLARGESL